MNFFFVFTRFQFKKSLNILGESFLCQSEHLQFENKPLILKIKMTAGAMKGQIIYSHTLCIRDATEFRTSEIGCNNTRRMSLWPRVRRRFCAFLDVNRIKCEQRIWGGGGEIKHIYLYFSPQVTIGQASPRGRKKKYMFRGNMHQRHEN